MHFSGKQYCGKNEPTALLHNQPNCRYFPNDRLPRLEYPYVYNTPPIPNFCYSSKVTISHVYFSFIHRTQLIMSPILSHNQNLSLNQIIGSKLDI